MIINIQYLDNYNLKEWGELKYQHIGDSGFDLRAAIDKPITLEPYGYTNYPDQLLIVPDEYNVHIRLISCGFKIELPQGYEVQIRPRSGLAGKHGITVLNAPGTVDSGYRGEIKVVLTNLSHFVYNINPGDRIAQAVIQKVPDITLRQVNNINKTERNENGFGSSGTK